MQTLREEGRKKKWDIEKRDLPRREKSDALATGGPTEWRGENRDLQERRNKHRQGKKNRRKIKKSSFKKETQSAAILEREEFAKNER